jgi:hypothetical protein
MDPRNGFLHPVKRGLPEFGGGVPGFAFSTLTIFFSMEGAQGSVAIIRAKKKCTKQQQDGVKLGNTKDSGGFANSFTISPLLGFFLWEGCLSLPRVLPYYVIHRIPDALPDSGHPGRREER